MYKICGVRAIGRSRWSDECGRSAIMIDRNGTPLCDEHACLANKLETPNENIQHIAWLIRDILEADGELSKTQQVAPEFCIEKVDTWAEGLVIHLGNGDLYELMIARIDENTT